MDAHLSRSALRTCAVEGISPPSRPAGALTATDCRPTAHSCVVRTTLSHSTGLRASLQRQGKPKQPRHTRRQAPKRRLAESRPAPDLGRFSLYAAVAGVLDEVLYQF